MKKKIILLVLIGFLLTPLVNASDIEEITTLNYLGKTPEILYGDVTLSFNWSERDNHSDIIPVKLSYNSTFDYTFYLFESKNISSTVNPSFVNDTKGYYFTSGGNDYVIYVDYRDFRSPLWDLEQLIKELNTTILILQSEITLLTSQNAYNHSLVETLNTELQQKKNELDNKITEYNTLHGQVVLIEHARDSAKNSYNETLSKYNDTVIAKNDLEWDLYYKNLSMEALTNPFSITYPKQGIDIIQFNAVWFFLGIIACLGGVVIFSKRQSWDNMKQGSLLQKLPFTRTEQRKSEEWNMVEPTRQELSDIEKEHLKPPKSVLDTDINKKLESSMEKIKEQKTTEPPPEPESPLEIPEPPAETTEEMTPQEVGTKKYWESPAGLKQKEVLRERARAWHKKDKN